MTRIGTQAFKVRVIVLLFTAAQSLFAQGAGDDAGVQAAAPVAADNAPAIASDIRNNKYYLESLRQTKLAEESYEYGDYDASAAHAAEAFKFAQQSDEYVARQLRIKAANDAIFAANSRLKWAASVNAAGRYPEEFAASSTAYDEAIDNRAAELWEDAVDAAQRVVAVLASLRDRPAVLPAEYTVRSWRDYKDCFWNIAGRSWAYGDPSQWPMIYKANKDRMPDLNNPDLIEPGMVLIIPSLKGEVRSGEWDPNATYRPMR
jgi:nucleoid-associated protein YgaU